MVSVCTTPKSIHKTKSLEKKRSSGTSVGCAHEYCTMLAADLAAIPEQGLLNILKDSLSDVDEIYSLSTRREVLTLLCGSALEPEITPLAAAYELGRRDLESYTFDRELSSPQAVHSYCATRMAELAHESFVVLCLNAKNILIHEQEISRGTLDATLVGIREICRAALCASARSVILVHNHPSGDPHPSSKDISLTKDIEKAAQLFEIDVLDHVIIGKRGRSYSLKSCGDM